MIDYDQHQLRQLRRMVGRNIYHLRAQRGLPLLRLAKRSGVHFGLLDRYEMGIGDIKLEHMLRIACALQTEVAELLNSGKSETSSAVA